MYSLHCIKQAVQCFLINTDEHSGPQLSNKGKLYCRSVCFETPGATPAYVQAQTHHLWGYVDEHHGLGLAAEGVLQQLCQLGVAEGHVLCVALRQRGHDVAQRAQAPVDVLCLLQPVPSRLTPAHPLAACTVA